MESPKKGMNKVLLSLGVAGTVRLLYWAHQTMPGRPFIRSEEVRIPSPDGYVNPAYIRRPAMALGQKRPALLLVHGGRGQNWFTTRNLIFNWTATELVRRGFIVMACDFRRRAFGGKEVDDVVAAFNYLAALPEVDVSRISMCGYSHGAYIALMASLRTPCRSVVSNWGPTDLIGMMRYLAETRVVRLELLIRDTVQGISTLITDNGKGIRESLKELSPCHHVQEFRCPILLVHGTRDGIVPVAQSTTFQTVMNEAGLPCETFIAEGGGHDFALGTGPHSREAFRRTLVFLLRTMNLNTPPASAI